MGHSGSNIERSPYYGALQGVVDGLFDGLEDSFEGTSDTSVSPQSAFPVEAASSTLDASGQPDVVSAAHASSTSRIPTTASPSTAAEAFEVSERAASLLGLGALVPDASSSESNPKPDVPAGPTIRRLDAVLAAEAADLPDDLVRIVRLLPPGDYTRDRLCTQLNSAIAGHAWGQVYGTVE